MKEYEGYRVTDRSKSQEALELIKRRIFRQTFDTGKHTSRSKRQALPYNQLK